MRRDVYLLGLLSFCCSSPALCQGQLPPATSYEVWIAYFGGPEGLQVLDRSKDTIRSVSIFAVQFDSTTHLVPASPWVSSTLVQLSTAAHPTFVTYLTVVNDVRHGAENTLKDPQMIHDVLSSTEARHRHIDDLLSWSRSTDGLDIDYEDLRKEDGEPFALFIEELASQLHAAGKRLCVTVEPKTDLSPGEKAKAMDWRRISAAADEVRVMAYYFHSPGSSPGPIAPLRWLSDLSTFALQEIPSNKLTVALTLNGLDWPPTGKARSLRYQDVQSLILEQNLKRVRDRKNQSPYLHYDLHGAEHTVWYEDVVSLQAKIKTLQDAGVRSIGFWQLGSGDPKFWGWLNSVKMVN
jgi:spore germination protein YaaH